jgi:hypothetical protein
MQNIGAHHLQDKDTAVLERLVTASTMVVMDSGKKIS